MQAEWLIFTFAAASAAVRRWPSAAAGAVIAATRVAAVRRESGVVMC